MDAELQQIGRIAYRKARSSFLFMIGCLVLSAAIGGALIVTSGIALQSTLSAACFLIAILCYMVVHEAIHLAFMALFSRGNVRISFSFPTISVGSDALYKRGQFITIALSPAIGLGVLLALMLLVVPQGYAFLLSLLLLLDIALSGGDFFQAFATLRYPKYALFQDDGDETLVFVSGR